MRRFNQLSNENIIINRESGLSIIQIRTYIGCQSQVMSFNGRF